MKSVVKKYICWLTSLLIVLFLALGALAAEPASNTPSPSIQPFTHSLDLFPSYATVGAPDQSQLGTATYTEYLERFVNEVKPQILSYDNYMVQYSDDLKDETKAAIYYADLLEIRRVGQVRIEVHKS